MNNLIAILFVHFVADFIFQTRKMATLKSTSVEWLSIHVFVYTLPLLLFGWKFSLVNGACHFIVDFFSSRATSYFWSKQNTHAFFAVIGFDQFLHSTCLILTARYFGLI